MPPKTGRSPPPSARVRLCLERLSHCLCSRRLCASSCKHSLNAIAGTDAARGVIERRQLGLMEHGTRGVEMLVMGLMTMCERYGDL